MKKYTEMGHSEFMHEVNDYINTLEEPIQRGEADPLTEEEILALGVERREIEVAYGLGDTVRVNDGPLAGFNGVVEELEPEKNRVRVVVSMFGRETPVDLELDQVEAIKD